MSSDPTDAYLTLLEALKSSGKEENRRQAFVAFAATAFGDDRLATDLALAAEYNVHFKSQGLVRRGSVDALYGNLVIEFENSIKKTGAHALDQLRGYVAGAWNGDGSTRRSYLAVATDGNRWETYVPTLLDPTVGIDADNIDLIPSASFDFNSRDDIEGFRNFLNRLFYRSLTLTPSAKNFARDFGLESPAFQATAELLREKVAELSDDSLYETFFTEWSAHLEKAYGTKAADSDLFIRHTYLATLARLLVWAALERKDPQPSDVLSVLDGTYFFGRGLANIWEDDYFKWPSISGNVDAVEGWQRLARQLSAYQLSAVREDILKPLYEELVDPEARHDLGEFYTPDWLASEVTNELLKSWDYSDGLPRVMDPTCGSGAFLRAVLEEVQDKKTDIDLYDVLDSVFGFDVLPLAVVVSRSTYVLAVQKLLESATSTVSIPVYLADSLTVPDVAAQPSLFGGDATVTLEVGEKGFDVPHAFVLNAAVFDAAMTACSAVAQAFKDVKPLVRADVYASLSARQPSKLATYTYGATVEAALQQLAYHLAELVQQRRDSIYGFVLRNSYRPSMSRGSVDYVVGNPPWLTIGDIEDSDYKRAILKFVEQSEIAPRKTGDQAHTELATVFLNHVTRFYLDPESKAGDGVRVGFVMPRSVFAASQHSHLRRGLYKFGLSATGSGLNIERIWDFNDVTPLFRVPSCALFASPRNASPNGIKPGFVYEGRLPAKEVPPAVARAKLKKEKG